MGKEIFSRLFTHFNRSTAIKGASQVASSFRGQLTRYTCSVARVKAV